MSIKKKTSPEYIVREIKRRTRRKFKFMKPLFLSFYTKKEDRLYER